VARRSGKVALNSAVVSVLVTAILGLAPAQRGGSPIFTFETNEFWLNLHHFLYVLGRAEAKLRDAARPAVVDAPSEAARVLETLSADDRAMWAEAVVAYSKGHSRLDPIFDEPLAAIAGALGTIDDAANLSGAAVDPSVRTVLERAAPLYRKAWWPGHRARNQSWRESIQPWLDRHGHDVLEFITKSYGMSWPAAGYPAHLVTYGHPLAAYSTPQSGLVLSTNAKSGMFGSQGLEMVFHEAMHQWDDEVLQLLRGHATTIGKNVPDNLPHAMIWVTAGRAVQRAVPEHVPFAEAFGLWKGYLAPLAGPVQGIWKPYLDGRGSRDEALAALVAKTATESR
jgi:hypothetical protein